VEIIGCDLHARQQTSRQEQLEADVRRTWPKEKPKREVYAGYTEAPAQIIPFKSTRKNGGGGGSRNIQAC
jgi:hypothetical protein